MAIKIDHEDKKGSYGPLSYDMSSENSTKSVKKVAFNLLGKLSERVSMDTIRPLPIFLGISGPSFCFSPEAFNPPSRKLDKNTLEKVKGRLSLNFSYFISNYALICFGAGVVVSLMNLKMIMYVAFVSTVWSFHTYTVKNNIPIAIGGTNLNDIVPIKTQESILTLITVLVVVFYCLVPLINVFCISAFLILSHSLMRDPKHIENSSYFQNESIDEEDDYSTEEVAQNEDIC